MSMNRVQLRKFKIEDFQHLFELLSDEAVMKLIEVPYTKEKTKEFLLRYGLVDQPLVYAVENEDKNFIGYVIYHPFDADSYEIGWVLHQRYWNQGYASELTEVLIEDAKGKTSDLVIECHPTQTITKRIAIKYGFVYNGNRGGCDVYKLDLHQEEGIDQNVQC